MRVLVFNGWAAGPETWSLCTFPHDWVFDYIEQMDGLPERVLADLDEFVMVGFSMGGNSVMRLLPSCAGRVKGLVLISTTPNMMEDKAAGWKGFSERRIQAFRLGTELVFRDDPSPLYAPSNLERGLDYLRTSDQRERLHRLVDEVPSLREIPVHVFQSDRDGIVRSHNAAWLKGLFPQAKVTMVSGTEHVLPVKVPDLIDAAVFGLLEEELGMVRSEEVSGP